MEKNRVQTAPDVSEARSPDGPEPSAAFTPGPWSHSGQPTERDPRVWVYAPDARGNSPRIATVEAVMRDGDRAAMNLANAHLIAAAPDLLKALRTAREQVVAFAIPSIGAEAAVKAVAHIDAAISAATGA